MTNDRVVMRWLTLSLILLGLYGGPGSAGVVFREMEVVESEAATSGSQQIRQVFAADEQCKVVLEQSSDPQSAKGSYILASAVDAFLVDPDARTIAPLDPTTMVLANPAQADAPGPAPVTAVAMELLLDEPAPALLGRPTRHLVWRLGYVVDHEGRTQSWIERHELWLTPWPEGETAPAAWLKLRLAEDGGAGAERAAIREALEPLYQSGLALRQQIERQRVAAAADGGPLTVSRVWREVTSLERQALTTAAFEPPAGYAQTEFLAPAPEVTPALPPERGDASGTTARTARSMHPVWSN